MLRIGSASFCINVEMPMVYAYCAGVFDVFFLVKGGICKALQPAAAVHHRQGKTLVRA